jgi:hypothetical protein
MASKGTVDSIGISSPAFAVDEGKPRIFIVDRAYFSATQESDEFVCHGRFFRVARRLSISGFLALVVEDGSRDESVFRSMCTPRLSAVSEW